MEVSKLANGITVVTESKSSLGCSMAIFSATGSRLESADTHGATHFLQHLAFKATEGKSHFGMTRAVEKLGGHVACGASRDCLTYAGECLSSNAGKLFGLMAETFTSPRLDKLDMDNARALVMADIQNTIKNGSFAVQDVLHTVAYQGETLGAPLMCSPQTAEVMTGDIISQFKSANFGAGKVVVSGTGIEHARLVEYVEANLGEMAKGSPSRMTPAKYVGGDCRVPSDPGQVHVAIGVQGVDCSDKEVVAAAVLQSLLGGGDQFSAGGPGKGLTSRIFRNVLSNPEVLTATSFNVSYQDTGLFGIQATCNAQDAPKTVALLTRELAGLKSGISAEELERAKNMTASSLFLNLETMGIVTEDLGRQTMYYGKRKDGATVAAEIKAVTAGQLVALASKMLASNVSVAAYGDVAFVPSYPEIAAALK
jgi:processing peptidase subunit alpha